MEVPLYWGRPGNWAGVVFNSVNSGTVLGWGNLTDFQRNLERENQKEPQYPNNSPMVQYDTIPTQSNATTKWQIKSVTI